MLLASLFRSLISPRPRTRAPRPRGGPAPRRPAGVALSLEPLEARDVPSFLAPLAFCAGGYNTSVAVGDFNGDGRPDLAVAYLGGAGSVFLGNGDGTFRLPRTFLTGGSSTSVAVGDFNGDGRPDLALGSS